MRFSFTVDDETGAQIQTFARTERRRVGNLALVAIEEYIARRLADRKRAWKRRVVKSVGRGAETAATLVAASPEGKEAGGLES